MNKENFFHKHEKISMVLHYIVYNCCICVSYLWC